MSLKKTNQCIDILSEYKGINPYLISLKKMLSRGSSECLSDFAVEYVLNNHEKEPLVINKTIKIAKWFSESKMNTWVVSFVPEKLLICEFFGETSKSIHVSIKYKRNQTEPSYVFIPKKALLDDIFLEDYNGLEIDFDPYDNIMSSINRKVLPHQKEAVKFLLSRRKAILADEPGLGKSQPLDSKVLTPNGFKKMGDIKVGDEVMGLDGNTQIVEKIYPQGTQPCYSFMFNDGSYVESSEDHLWKVNIMRKNYIYTTKELYDRFNNEKHASRYLKCVAKAIVPSIKPMNFEEKEIDIDLNVLGKIVGYGITNITQKREPKNMTKKELEFVKKNGLYNFLETDERFIPDIIKYNSIDVRVKFVRGLFLCDGIFLEDTTQLFFTLSKRLRDDVTEIIRSLGGTVELSKKTIKPEIKGVEKEVEVYVVRIRLDNSICLFENFEHIFKNQNPFYKKTNFNPKKTIKFINKIEDKKCQCIKVSNQDHLYITDDYIPTHNTTSCILSSLEGKFKKTLIICPANAKSDWYRDLCFLVDKNEIGVVESSNWTYDKKFVIVNYDIIDRFHKPPKSRKKEDIEYALQNSILIKENFDLLIIDEVHTLSNNSGLRASTIDNYVKLSGIKNIFGVSGTPITNRPMDYFNILKIIGHPLSEDWEYYVKNYCEGKQITSKSTGKKIWLTNGASNLDELYEKTKGNYLRRLKSNLSDYNITQEIKTVEYDLNQEEEEEYKNIWEEYVESNRESGKEVNEEYKMLTEGILLRQYISNKMIPKTIELTKKHLEKGEKVFIVCCFDEEVNQLKEAFGDIAVIYNGKITKKKKENAKSEFMTNPNVKVFIGNIKAAGTSLTLTSGNICIFNSFSWTPNENVQVLNRLNRIGQTKNVIVYFQVFKKTIGLHMMNTVLSKQINIDQVIKPT